MCATLTACQHKTQWTPPNVLTAPPLALDTAPAADYAPEIASVPPPEFIPLTDADPFPKPVRKRPTAPVPREGGPAPVAQGPGTAAPESAPELALGSLSAGGESGPQLEQEARNLIASIQRREAGLPRPVVNQERNQLRQVASFLKRAQQALESGDAEGSVNLATKARLIMDDIEKR